MNSVATYSPKTESKLNEENFLDESISLKIDIDNIKAFKGTGSVHYIPILVLKDGKPIQNSLSISFNKDVHFVGSINPISEKEANRINTMNAHFKNKSLVKVRPNANKATLSFQKYRTYIETDSQGSPVKDLPEDSEITPLFKVYDKIETCLRPQLENFIKNGKIDGNEKISLSKKCNIFDLVQREFSHTNSEMGGQPMVNPICRMNIRFSGTNKDADQVMKLNPNIKIYDADKSSTKTPIPYKIRVESGDEEFVYEELHSHNIHLLPKGLKAFGTIKFEICHSSQGLSFIPTPNKLYLINPVYRDISIEDDPHMLSRLAKPDTEHSDDEPQSSIDEA